MSGVFDQALWDAGRATGVTALVIFTATMVLGIVARSGRSALGIGRFGVSELHRTLALTGVGLLICHVLTLLFDPYAQLRLVDLVVPFGGSYRPLWLGLGTVSLDLLAVTVVSSLLRHRIGPRAFKVLHSLTYVLWPTAFAHALGNGTDAGSVWLNSLAFACLSAVVLAVGWRLSRGYGERGRARVPRRLPQKVTQKSTHGATR